MKLTPLASLALILAACGAPGPAAVADEAPAVVVTSPAALAPQDTPCDAASVGAVTERKTLVSHDGNPPVEVASLNACVPFFSQFSWSGWVSATTRADFFDQPLRAVHAAFLTVRDPNGAYLNSVVVKLLEGQERFLSVECFADKGGMTQYQAGYARGDAADAPQAAVCESFAPIADYGAVQVTFVGDAPTARFVPANGAAPVDLTVFALRN